MLHVCQDRFFNDTFEQTLPLAFAMMARVWLIKMNSTKFKGIAIAPTALNIKALLLHQQH